MKKLCAIILALVLMLSLAACNQDKGSAPSTAGTESSGETGTTEPTSGVDADTDVVNDGVEREEVTVLAGITATNADGSMPYEYKWETLERRLMTTMTASAGGTTMTVDFAYRESGRSATVTGLASGVAIDFTWDENGRIVSFVETSTGGTYGVAYIYDQDGRCTEKSVSRNGEPASKITYTYDGGDLVKEITTLPDGSVSNQKTCAYNENGDLTEEITQWTGAEPVVKRYTYTYNDGGKPVIRITMDGENVQTAKHAYTYDSEGRVLTETSFNGDTRASHTEYTYDENGNLTKERLFLTGEDASRTVDYTYETVRMSDMEYRLYQMLLDQSQGWY